MKKNTVCLLSLLAVAALIFLGVAFSKSSVKVNTVPASPLIYEDEETKNIKDFVLTGPIPPFSYQE